MYRPTGILRDYKPVRDYTPSEAIRTNNPRDIDTVSIDESNFHE